MPGRFDSFSPSGQLGAGSGALSCFSTLCAIAAELKALAIPDWAGAAAPGNDRKGQNRKQLTLNRSFRSAPIPAVRDTST
jgi:hypothetical protein